MAAAQLFNDSQTDQLVLAIPLLSHHVRYYSNSQYGRPALKVQSFADGQGGGGGKTPGKSGSGKGLDGGAGNGKQAGEGGGGGAGDDKLVRSIPSFYSGELNNEHLNNDLSFVRYSNGI